MDILSDMGLVIKEIFLTPAMRLKNYDIIWCWVSRPFSVFSLLFLPCCRETNEASYLHEITCVVVSA